MTSVIGTTGVQVHGMYTGLMLEPERSPRHDRSDALDANKQGMETKFAAGDGEVRCHRSSEEHAKQRVKEVG